MNAKRYIIFERNNELSYCYFIFIFRLRLIIQLGNVINYDNKFLDYYVYFVLNHQYSRCKNCKLFFPYNHRVIIYWLYFKNGIV
jgi:hypothetical protein